MSDYNATHVPDDDCIVYDNSGDDSPVTGVTEKARVSACLSAAKGRSFVIDVTAPSGREYQFLPYITQGNVGTIWIEYDLQTDDSKIVEERTVWNLVFMSRPDVSLLRESETKFAGDPDDE